MFKSKNLLPRAALLFAMVLMLTACAIKTPALPSSGVMPSAIPPLAASAHQPPTPLECLPTCSDGLIAERASWPATPTPVARPASSASATTTP